MTYALEKPSRAYNLTYLFFGYVLASMFVTKFYELPLQDRVLFSVSAGSFIGAFLFYLKPESFLIEWLVRFWFRFYSPSIPVQVSRQRAAREGTDHLVPEKDPLMADRIVPGFRRPTKSEIHETLVSPFLLESKAYLVGALYFALSLLAGCLLIPLERTLQLMLIAAASLLVMKFMYETWELRRMKILPVVTYYRLLDAFPFLPAIRANKQAKRRAIASGKDAMIRGDWLEAHATLVEGESVVEDRPEKKGTSRKKRRIATVISLP